MHCIFHDKQTTLNKPKKKNEKQLRSSNEPWVFFFSENIGTVAAGPAGPVPTQLYNVVFPVLFQYGLTRIIYDDDGLNVLARSLDPSTPAIMTDVLKILAALSLVPPHG